MAEPHWHKLTGGEWGVKGPEGLIIPGNKIKIKNRAGEVTEVTVDKKIWRNNGQTIATIKHEVKKTTKEITKC